MSADELQKILMDNPALAKKNPSLVAGSSTSSEKCSKSAIQEKKPKYRNRKVYVYEDGYLGNDRKEENHGSVTAVFDSQKEYRRWQELLILSNTGVITNLRRQVHLTIQEAFDYQGEKIREVYYSADFVYEKDGCVVIEDVKGYSSKTKKFIETKDFVLKWKLLKRRYPEYQFRVV